MREESRMNGPFATRAGARGRALLLALATLAVAAGCSSSTKPGGTIPAARSYRMGFSGIPPRNDFAIAVAAINMWIPRADAAIFHSEAPWESLLADVPPETLVVREMLPLAQYYRAHGLQLVVMVDPTNGLNRASDANGLVAAGRSLTEPAMQQLLRTWVVAVDTLLSPDYLGLAAETNLIRAIAPASLYDAVRVVASDAAADVRAVDPAVRLFSSVQVEVAWGVLVGGVYEGVDQDRADFPFHDMLGLSSYPYFSWPHPDSLPADYYARLVETNPIPTMIIEGGWSSQQVVPWPTSPAVQAAYIRRQSELLDEAGCIGAFQLTFTDLDTTAIPLPPGVSLAPFAHLGLVDVNLVPKPALEAWDATFRRPLAPGP